MNKDREKLQLSLPCKKRTFVQKILKIEPMHEWQSRAINRYGLSTYEVCLRCGEARERNQYGKHPSFVKCNRLSEFDSQFDEKGNYIFK